ncbi:hypothetical protein EDC04DRAFT_2606531 [Pisolithus marmoratus]|nr:hypothetical protein EDC04DRAFT_2606531 [Pisolithus marmoratus]
MHLGSQLAVSHPPLSQGPASLPVTTTPVPQFREMIMWKLLTKERIFYAHLIAGTGPDDTCQQMLISQCLFLSIWELLEELFLTEQLSEAFEHGCQLMKWAHGRQVILEIHNLCKPTQATSTNKVSLQKATAAELLVEAHAGASGGTQPSTVMSFASEFCKLKERLSCAQHTGKYCYVMLTGDHDALDICKLTSWAKSIFLGNATYEQPPEMSAFDHMPKQCCTSSSVSNVLQSMMPLEPQPPSSPHGKVVPAKHYCLSAEPCPIHLLDVGRRYHSFPKGTFKANFTPPIFPKFVLHHFASHPPIWTWTTKDSPNKGKSFKVPTIPIICKKAAPCTIHWVVAVFHLFKTHLHPVAIDANTGKVHQGWLHLYQNNLWVHLLYLDHDGSSGTLTNPPTWLVTVLQTPDLPQHFHAILMVHTPLTLAPLPGNTLEAVRLQFDRASPIYTRIGPEGVLAFSTIAEWSVSDDENDPTIQFPAITDALQQLDTMMLLLNMLQYEDNLISHGVAYVNSVMGIQEEFFIDVVGMPLGAVHPFLATTHWLIHWAKKGKGRAVDDGNKENKDPSDCHTPEIC